MTEGTRSLTVGMVGGTPVVIDVTTLGSPFAIGVTLTSNYATLRPPGFPSRPAYTGAPFGSLDVPQTIASGTTVLLFKAEADALVNAGFATYVPEALLGRFDFSNVDQSHHVMTLFMAAA